MVHSSFSPEIAEIVQRIASRFDPDKIILFGSHARGDAGPDSDIDLLILFSHLANPLHRQAELYRALIGCTASPKDLVVSTTERFERYKNIANTVYWPAAREGKVIYERTA
jgi:uncharacterized protein